jgi:predicted ArsR family transcriptional regulator
MASTVITLGAVDTPPSGPVGEVADTTRYRALSATSRVRMLHLVGQAGTGMTVAEVAAATGLHPSTVRAHLEQLAGSGLLTRHRQPDGSPGRPAWRYQAVERPGARADRPYRDLAAALIGHLARAEDDPHAAGVRAGRDWGRALAAPLGRTAPVDGLVRVLDRLGFTPDVVDREDAGAAVVYLRSCPFLELAQASPDVVCGVHLGVIGGALGAMGGSAADTTLEPFAVPGACVIRVRTADGGAARAESSPADSGDVPGGARPHR